MTHADVVRAIIPEGPPAHITGQAHAHANLALVKYWGKRDDTLNLPVTSSLSIALGQLGTQTHISTDTAADTISHNGEPVPPTASFAKRLTAFLDLVRPTGTHFAIETSNTIPTGAGLASSASGYAALVLALDNLFGWQLTRTQLSILARLGSGSASRSLHPGFVIWQAGEQADGMDSHAVPLDITWPDLRLGILALHTGPKSIGSRPAMAATRDQSPLYATWPELCRTHLRDIQPAIRARDLDTVGTIAESNALCMHATMLGAWPPILYWQADTVAALHRIWQLRSDGLPVYATMDAGPNIKLIFEAPHASAIRAAFPAVQIVNPFEAP